MSSAFEQAKDEIDERRRRSLDRRDSRTDEVYRKIPKLEEITLSINSTSIQVAKELIKGGEDVEKRINEIKENNQMLRDNVKYLMSTAGYPEDYLTNVYTCSKCEDMGFIDNKKCSCLETLIIQKLYQISNIKEVLETENFDTFNIKYFSEEKVFDGITPRQSMTINFKVAQDFVNKFESVYRNLYLFGSTGRGKTFLCNCIAKEIIDKGHIVIYVSATDLFKKLEEYKFYRNENQHNQQFIEYLEKADLLIIDDLGTELHTQFTSSELFNIINRRHTERKHTIISSNLAIHELENVYSSRIESRLIGNFENLKFVGDDIRQLKKFN